MPREEKSWISRWWRALVGEVVATALLMILGVGSLLPSAPLTHPALGFGFVITGLIQAFGAISGAHMNPAVTLAAFIHAKIQLIPAIAYVIAQIVGAFIGFGVLMCVAPMPEQCAGVTLPSAEVAGGAAAAVEALLTGTLVLAVGGVWAAERGPAPPPPDTAAPTKIGLTVAGLVYAGGKLTGASLNPARSLAPAALRGCWRAHWVYWLGPLAGAALCALAHRALLPPPPPPAARAPAAEGLPLHDKHDH